MDSSTNAPSVSAQADGATATQEVVVATKAEATDGELPPSST